MNLEYNLIFLTEAELELKALITRYNIIQEGLGDKFLLYLIKNIKILGYYTQRNIRWLSIILYLKKR